VEGDTSDDHLFSGRGCVMYLLDKKNGKLDVPICVNPYVNVDGWEVVVNPDGNYAYCSTACHMAYAIKEACRK
jgi:hypothetical protein